MFFNKNLAEKILSLNRYTKKGLAIVTDIFLSIFTLWLAFYFRLEEFVLLKDIGLSPITLTIFLTTLICWTTGLYETLFRHAGLSILSTISLGVTIYGLFFFLIISLYGIKNVPRSIGLIQPVLLFMAIVASRIFIKYFLRYISTSYNQFNNFPISLLRNPITLNI